LTPVAETVRFRLADGHNLSAYRQVFARHGRIHVPQLLAQDCATSLSDALTNEVPWNVTAIRGDLVYDIKPQEYAAMSADQLAKFDAELNRAAQVQYVARYRTFRFCDHGERFDGDIAALSGLSEFLNGDAFLGFARAITGKNAIRLADAQATCYWPGDFLHPHRDVVAEKKRMFAYVLNITPSWKTEWGGLLGFIDGDGHLEEAYTPKWNALNLFDISQHHYVSQVASFAAAYRYSITGWLRAG
jgi:SM-20-related protein